MTGPQTVASADGTRIAYYSVGSGDPVIVVGGVLRTAEDYRELARALSPRFEVHVVDRRGRGGSGPQGAGYGIDRECDDVDAVRRATGARRVFGHSYGGLVALEAAKRIPELTDVAVYEPGVSVRGSIPTGWLDDYEEHLTRGDTRAAFATLVRGSGHAPALVSRLPLGTLKLVLRFAIRDAQWRRMEPLLEANLVEHQEVRRLDGTAASYGSITARVLLLCGAKSPRSSKLAVEALDRVLPNATVELLRGLAHTAPDEGAPQRVAERLDAFFRAA